MATVNPTIFQKFKKISIRQEGDGLENKVEVREDEEQSVKFQEIIDLLVAAGYFRARIKGLSPFDKVVGGMTWCIESCNVDIDVDLLFQENSTIGQKISLTEKLVAVLPKMKCPHRIEPHQIQGLDFIHVFPVIQWLVKKSMEFRQEMSSFVRSYAVNQFNKTFSIKNKKLEAQQQVLGNINKVAEVYKPRRYYKRKTALPEDLSSRVQITLLEYGLYGVRNNIMNKSSEIDTLDDHTQEHQVEYGIMTEDDRRELFKHYSELKLQMEDTSKYKEEEEILKLEQQKLLFEKQYNKLIQEKEAATRDIADIENSISILKTKQEEASHSLTEVEKAIGESDGNVEEIEELVKQNNSIRLQETQFKEQCKQELRELELKIEEAKRNKTSSENSDRINKDLEEEMEKLKSIRLHLAKKNRIISVLQRQLDEIPSRPELAQYQRRFLELYNQVAAKHKETKQYYTLYNTLEDTKLYITKELSLLNSISDNYPEAMQSSASREEFLKQFENIVEGVRQSRNKIEQRLSEEKQARDQLSNTLHGLIEVQRRYVAAIKQLSIECKKYETLLSQSKS